jgi:hypothetical protein
VSVPERPPDLIGVAFGGIASGAATTGVVVTLGVLALRDRLAPVLPLLLFGGIVAGAVTAWLLTAPLAVDAWRRGVTTALAVFAGLLLAFLSAPADRLAGRPGLVGYAVLLGVAATVAGRYARRRARG